MRTLIVIPARYGSTRFPGKPLEKLDGRPMVLCVADAAREACKALEKAEFVVATDDDRIRETCAAEGVHTVMTPSHLPSGTDRTLAAYDALACEEDVIVNLQGDAPFTPAKHIVAVVRALIISRAHAATPVVRLSWEALDAFRAAKADTPFSGTTCIRGPNGDALWFSKQILPAIRDEARLRGSSERSPVLRHIGLYAYTAETLRRFAALEPSPQEGLEGLEQLRLLEHGYRIRVVEVSEPDISVAGIDTPQDLARASALLAQSRADDA